MKKTAIALAISAAAASTGYAQNIVIDGYIDRAYESTNSNLNTSDAVRINSSSGTSTIGFSGSEDLGGGLRASFRINTDFADQGGMDFDRATANAANSQGLAFANSQLWLQIGAKDLGDLRLGTVNAETLTAVSSVAQPALSTGVGSIYSTGYSVHGGMGTGVSGQAGLVQAATFANDTVTYTGARAIRQRDSVYYYSPDVNGFKFAAGMVTRMSNGGTGTDNVGVNEYSLRYTKGMLDVMYVNLKYSVGTNVPLNAANLVANSAQTNQSLGAALQITPAVKLHAGWFTTKQTGGNTINQDSTATSFGASWAATPAITLMAVTSSYNDKVVSTNMDRGLNGFGANYSLSKRTRAYVRYDTIKTDNSNAATAGNSFTRTAVGVAHTF